jgi:hypothetical protein
MVKMHILVDGKYYVGEDLSQVVGTSPRISSGATGGGMWHVNNDGGVHPLRFSKDTSGAKVIQGPRNLRSEMDRILTRISQGLISPSEVKIVFLEEE